MAKYSPKTGLPATMESAAISNGACSNETNQGIQDNEELADIEDLLKDSSDEDQEEEDKEEKS